MISVDPSLKPAMPKPISNIITGFAIGVAASSILSTLASRQDKFLFVLAFISGIYLVIDGLIHLNRTSDRDAPAKALIYWNTIWRVILGFVIVSLPTIDAITIGGVFTPPRSICDGSHPCLY
jgi:uncharacterized membrane protein YbjE (DUF340 family)